MTEEQLIEEATQRGFLRAATFKPAHIKCREDCPEIVVPEGAKMIYGPINGDLYFKSGNSAFLSSTVSLQRSWIGKIYHKATDTWAEIVTYRGGKVNTLTEFPKTGVCWNSNEELLKYLQQRPGMLTGQSISFSETKNRGLAWNSASLWTVSTTSNRTEYTMQQLLPYMPSFKSITEYPLTPEECYTKSPDKWYIRITPENVEFLKTFLIQNRDKYIGYQDAWNPSQAIGSNFYFPQINERMYSTTVSEKSYTEISTEFFLKEIYVDEPIVEKWCIRVKQNNIQLLEDFLKERKNEWKEYRDNWCLNPGSFFHYPPFCKSAHSSDNIEEGYTEVSTHQIIHVLTNKINNENKTKQNGSEKTSVKVQRPNLTIRDSGDIRATGIRCSKIQIKIGSGHLPD